MITPRSRFPYSSTPESPRTERVTLDRPQLTTLFAALVSERNHYFFSGLHDPLSKISEPCRRIASAEQYIVYSPKYIGDPDIRTVFVSGNLRLFSGLIRKLRQQERTDTQRSG